MTSQTWRTGATVNHPVWWHTLVVIIPEVVEFKDWATLTLDFGVNTGNGSSAIMNNRHIDAADDEDFVDFYIDSSNLEERLPDLKRAVHEAAFLAVRTRAPAASLLNLPNEGEIFGNDPVQKDRAQDFLKAYSYQDFLDHPDEPERISELPIAKAVVRAMDTVQAFTASLPTGAVKRFGVTGYSKLGTATYVVAAADSRVRAIVPCSIYLEFRMLPSVDFGPMAPVVTELSRKSRRAYYYVDPGSDMNAAYRGVVASQATPEYDRLSSIIDPVRWADRLSLPKLVVLGTSDEVVGHWLMSLEDQVPSLPGQTAFLKVPNSDHDDTLVRSLGSSAAFFRGFLLGLPPPSVRSSWEPLQRTILATQVDNTAVRPVASRHWDAPEPNGLYVAAPMEVPSQSGPTWPCPLPAYDHPVYSFVEFEYEWPEPGFRYSVSGALHSTLQR